MSECGRERTMVLQESHCECSCLAIFPAFSCQGTRSPPLHVQSWREFMHPQSPTIFISLFLSLYFLSIFSLSLSLSYLFLTLSLFLSLFLALSLLLLLLLQFGCLGSLPVHRMEGICILPAHPSESRGDWRGRSFANQSAAELVPSRVW